MKRRRARKGQFPPDADGLWARGIAIKLGGAETAQVIRPRRVAFVLPAAGTEVIVYLGDGRGTLFFEILTLADFRACWPFVEWIGGSQLADKGSTYRNTEAIIIADLARAAKTRRPTD